MLTNFRIRTLYIILVQLNIVKVMFCVYLMKTEKNYYLLFLCIKSNYCLENF